MPAELSEFEDIPGLSDFFTATKGGLRCTAIGLKSGGICLHSPVAGLGPKALGSLNQLGEVTYLLAPNHYHNKGLGEYADHFPKAQRVAPTASQARLQKITGLRFDDLGALQSDLPAGTRLVHPDGLKTGEVWIVTKTAWIVVDAFAGPTQKEPARRLLGTFPKYGVGDRDTYVDWVKNFLQTDPPKTLIPCHGDILSGPSLVSELTKALDQMT